MLGTSGMPGFGAVFYLQDAFSQTIQRVKSEFKSLEGITEAMQQQATSAGNNIKMGFAAMAAGAVALMPALASINPAAELEQTMVSFEVMMGSAEKAKKMVSDLQDMAAKTPFETKDLTRGAEMLMNYGITAEKVIPT